jgi:hypothetical protein
MMLLPVALSTLALAATTLAAPLITVKNNCKFDVYVTSVGKTAGQPTKVQPNKSWTEAEYFSGTGTAIKITKTANGLYTSEPTLQLGYTYTKKDLYYSLNTVPKYGFPGQKITVKEDQGKKEPTIQWNDAAQLSDTLYHAGETGLTLQLCA